MFSAQLMSPGVTVERHGLGEKCMSVYMIINLQDIYTKHVFFPLCLQLIISFGD